MPKPADFDATFKTLRALLKPKRHFVVVADKPGKALPRHEDVEDEIRRRDLVGGAEIREHVSSTDPRLRRAARCEGGLAVAAEVDAGEVVLQLHGDRSRALKELKA
jgi:hypothetical protein